MRWKRGNRRSRPVLRPRVLDRCPRIFDLEQLGPAPPHHECEEVVYILRIEDKTVPFAADCTLIFPPRLAHQITNTGAETVRLVAWLSESPAGVFLPSGERLALPWDCQRA